MSYYDNVKDSIKDKEGSGSSGSSTPNFDTLKKAAEETSNQEEEEKGDDTEIEVLEEGLGRSTTNQSGQSSSGSSQTDARSRNQKPEQNVNDTAPVQQSSSQRQQSSKDTSGLEEKLDRIIEQNDRMIEILESFGS